MPCSFALWVVLPLLAGVQSSTDARLPTVEAVLERYVDALGGRAALERVTSRVSQGLVRIAPYDLDGTISIYEKTPDYFLSVSDFPEYGVMTRGLGGTTAWIQSPDEDLIELSGPSLARFRASVDFRRDLTMAQRYSDLTLTRDEFRNQPVYTLRGRMDDVAETLRFSVDTGLLIHRRSEVPGEGASETTYEDYRSIDGARVPFRTRVSNDEMTITTELKEVRHNVEIENAKFAKPGR